MHSEYKPTAGNGLKLTELLKNFYRTTSIIKPPKGFVRGGEESFKTSAWVLQNFSQISQVWQSRSLNGY